MGRDINKPKKKINIFALFLAMIFLAGALVGGYFLLQFYRDVWDSQKDIDGLKSIAEAIPSSEEEPASSEPDYPKKNVI